MTYEAGIAELIEFPVGDEPVWILGKSYSTRYDFEELKSDVRSKLWFTYRKGFYPIGGTGPTTDTGWGCMLRCGQMVLAQSLIWTHLGREWVWHPDCGDKAYHKILRMFEDKKSAPYSIHQIAQMGVSEGKSVGQWFGPNTVAQVLKKLVVYDEWSSINVHVSMDSTIVTNDIKESCKSAPELSSDLPSFPHTKLGAPDVSGSKVQNNSVNGFIPRTRKTWRPLLLFVPLRLGLNEINPVYISGLKKCFTLKQSLGIIGGRPNHASYFIGYMGDELVFLDPHTTHPIVCLDCHDPNCKTAGDDSYHCSVATRMDIFQLDPSIALCFYCRTEDEFDDLCQQFRKNLIELERQPLFELCTERPVHWQQPNLELMADVACARESESLLQEVDRQFDTSDDEFEILG